MPTLHLEIIPRPQFRPFLTRAQRWALLVVHRRGGKTFACIQDLIHKSLTHQRDGIKNAPLRYGYVAPTRDQAKDIAWGYLTQFCSQIPGTEINKSELMMTLPKGQSIRLYSGENYERMRGIYFDGVVVDEPADIDPNAWDTVIRPCLSDYNGWGIFIGTSKGRNHFWKKHLHALEDPEWYHMMLKASQSGIIPEDELKDIRKGISPEAYSQEYECDFSVGRPGAIYSRDIEKAREEKRINDDVLWYKELPVYTSFDVGAALNQKVWIFQCVGSRINYLESLSGDADCKTPADWAQRLRSKQYSYGSHFIPHDAAADVGGLWQDAMTTAGLTHVVPVPRQHYVWDGIRLAQDAFPRIHFNKSGCEDGLNALDSYQSKEERDGATISDIPIHNWASHYSDSFSLSHQAIHKGLIIDRSAIVRKPKNRLGGKVIAGFRG